MRKKVPATKKEGVSGIAPLRSVLEICAIGARKCVFSYRHKWT